MTKREVLRESQRMDEHEAIAAFRDATRLRSAIQRARVKAEAERDEAREETAQARVQLAALHAAAQRFRDAVGDDGLTCRDNGLDSAAAVEEEWGAIDRALADLATAAAEHERRVQAMALRRVASVIEGFGDGIDGDGTIAGLLRAMADEAERRTR